MSSPPNTDTSCQRPQVTTERHADRFDLARTTHGGVAAAGPGSSGPRAHGDAGSLADQHHDEHVQPRDARPTHGGRRCYDDRTVGDPELGTGGAPTTEIA